MKHPPFVGQTERSGSDYLDEDGAYRLAALIRAAWASVGHDVECRIVQVIKGQSSAKASGSVWAVRMPSLVNGLPVA